MKTIGFSTIELLIALALMSVVLVSAIMAISSAQYWFLTAQTATEALHKNKVLMQNLDVLSKINFQQVSSSIQYISSEPDIVSDQSCLEGGLCYHLATTVMDVSSCSKGVEASVEWNLGKQYPTSSIVTNTHFVNLDELMALGGDCVTDAPNGDWSHAEQSIGNSLVTPAQGNTGFDVLGEYMYITSMTSPYLRIFEIFDDVAILPLLVGSSSVSQYRLNDIDVIKDFQTGRLYAYVVRHSTSSQLLVFDVTEADTPVLVRDVPLLNVPGNGSFPQGWRVMAYGGQLFVVSRETSGPELHIFSIQNPRQPIEITSSAINLNRTVNDMVVRDEVLNNETKRFLYLAASADLKEVGVYDVSDPVPVEIAAINLNGTADAVSMYLTGNQVYIGRKNSSAPELYVFNLKKLIQNELETLAVAEVGGDVLSLHGIGKELIVGTSKNGFELQIWSTDVQRWDAAGEYSGRLSVIQSPRLAPLGIDIQDNFVYLLSHSETQPETISVAYIP